MVFRVRGLLREQQKNIIIFQLYKIIDLLCRHCSVFMYAYCIIPLHPSEKSRNLGGKASKFGRRYRGLCCSRLQQTKYCWRGGWGRGLAAVSSGNSTAFLSDSIKTCDSAKRCEARQFAEKQCHRP